MDNNELDRILKEKLKNQIKPSQELENKILEKIKEQKEIKLKENKAKEVKDETKTAKKIKTLQFVVTVAAVAVIGVGIGTYVTKEDVDLKNEQIVLTTIKSIEPTKAQNGIIENDTEFLIYTEGENITEQKIQENIYVEPALDYTIEKTNNQNEYKLTFKQNIPDNTIVKLQYVKDKITQNSWAYQTSNKLSVSSTYPGNNSAGVSKNSVIEIEFSYASVENLEEKIEISPNVNGTWEHIGKVWRFTPEKQLEEGVYTVKINSGITAEGQTLEDAYTFKFEVSQVGQSSYIYNTISLDGINTYKTDENVKIYCKASDMQSKLNISSIELRQFKTMQEFIDYLTSSNYDTATSLGDYKFSQTNEYVQFEKALQEGYYVAIIKGKNSKEIFNCPIQINNISAYAMETERDVLVWVAQGENLSSGVKVKYLGKEQTTNNEGIAKFEDIADNSETIKYLQIGNAENKLVVGLYNYKLDNYPRSYIYTDRLLYKNTDTINIWGFVPTKLFYDEIVDEFYIQLGSEEKQKVTVDQYGNLNYKIELKNHADTEYTIVKLYYKDSIIAEREIEIEKYELQNYSYEIIADKNYAYSGENYEFDVKVIHVTGLAVPNKNVLVKIGDETYRKTTDEEGKAHLSIKMYSDVGLATRTDYERIEVSNGDLEEYTDVETSKGVYVINRSTYTNIDSNEDETYKLTLYQLSKEKKVNVSYELSEIYEGTYNTNVKISLKEIVSSRHIAGYYYNQYTKQNEPYYNWENTAENISEIKTVNTQNGLIEVNKDELNLKKDTEDTSYMYYIIIEYKDSKGNDVKDEEYVSKYEAYLSDSGLGYVYDWLENSDLLYESNSLVDGSYYTYRYLLKKDTDIFSIGDTVNFTLAESTENGIKDINNEGKILRIVLQEDITKTEIISDDNFDYTFTEKDFPGCKITTAYFYKGKFYRMPTYYFDFNEEDRKVDIQITADKEEYKPGDEVSITVKTTNNGSPIKSSVNISVVNEAVFAIEGDLTNLSEEIYTNKALAIYTYSSYYDYINNGLDGGRRRRWRSKNKLWRHCIL